MAGLTRYGLEIKDEQDVITDLQTTASEIFADLVPAGDVVDVSDNSALGRMIGVVTPSISSLWEAIQQIYDSFNPTTAQGIALDNIIALSGISRFPARATRAQVLLEGTTNVVVSSPLGKAYSSTTQHVFSIANPVVLNPQNASGMGIVVSTPLAGQTYTVGYSLDGGVNYIDASIVAADSVAANILAQIKAQVDILFAGVFTTYYQDGRLFISRIDPFQTAYFQVTPNLRIEKIIKLGVAVDDMVGPFVQPMNSIDTISVPIAGWDRVTNPVAAAVGRYTETDEELRERFRNSKFVQSANIIEALVDALQNVQGVEDVIVYENDTDTTDTLGVTPHSFLPIVLGGLPSEIGEAIWQNKPTGIQSIGNTTVQITDSQDLIHNISFTRPTEKPVYITMVLTGYPGISGTAASEIRQNIVNYFDTNNKIGDDVIYSRLYTPINSVPGFQVDSLTIGYSASPTGMANLPVAFNEVATINPANILITIN